MPRPRSRRLGRPRGRRMKGDWIVMINDNCPTALTVEPCDAPTLAGAEAGTFLLIDTADVGAKQDSLTCMRIVGDIHHACRVAYGGSLLTPGSFRGDRWILYEGIYKSMSDDLGAIVVLDPRASLDMESDQWMWRRTTMFHAGVFTNSGGTIRSFEQFDNGQEISSNGGGAHIDVVVKRKLSASDVLAYTAVVAEAPIIGTTDITRSVSFEFWPQLRGYVKF